MSEHPIRLLVTDDLKRTRLTVGLRLLLGVPHYIWLTIWSIVAFFAAVLNWLATLVLGRSPAALHRFLAAYVKYVTQFFAYMRLAANPYPSFDGLDGYPLDLTIAPAARQNRATVLLRLPLALPALLIGALFGNSFTPGRRSNLEGSGIATLASIFAWFVGVGQHRTPRGLRDVAAWSLGYGAQIWGYLLLLTDRYPNSNPLAMLPEVPAREDPVRLSGQDDLHRSRLTVLFRLPLSFPHLLWLTLWSLLAILATVANWLATLIAGRPPAALHSFLARYLRYEVSVYAFLSLVANPFPGFAGAAGRYPALEAHVAPPTRQNRWKTAFRLPLAVPAALLAGGYSTLLLATATLTWFSALVRGRAPAGLRTSGALAIRYHAATIGYGALLTDAYPYSGPLQGDGPSGPSVASGLSGPSGLSAPGGAVGSIGPGGAVAPGGPAAPPA